MQFICDSIENVDVPFDIGLGLHVCGAATDYAQVQCFRHRASFILCSCCNGKCCRQSQRKRAQRAKGGVGIKEDVISEFVAFPRSQCLRNAIQSEEGGMASSAMFEKLTCFSDFNFDTQRFEPFADDDGESGEYRDYCGYVQKRKFCKIICELDRCLAALEIGDGGGYDQVTLTQITPNNKLFQCSPKSDVIVGIHSRFQVTSFQNIKLW